MQKLLCDCFPHKIERILVSLVGIDMYNFEPKSNLAHPRVEMQSIKLPYLNIQDTVYREFQFITS